MATCTFTTAGVDTLWSNAANWDTFPADGDDCIIPNGQTCTFDADQSAFTTGVKVTINGTLTHTTNTGNYCLFAKTGASIVGAGTWNIGTSGAPIPYASKHTITGAAGWYVDGVSGLTMNVYGAEPTYKYVKLSADEAAGQTELSVDTDVTGDIWAAGDIVRIDNVNKGRDSEERVIATGGIATNAITITAGLTAAKLAGTYVLLITRNIRIIAAGAGTRTIYRVGSTDNKLTIGSGMFYGVNKNMLENCHYCAISGGAFSRNDMTLYICISATISGGMFSGNTYGLYNCTTAAISGGTFSGNNQCLLNCIVPIISDGTFSENGSGLYGCSSASISGGTFSGNNYDLWIVDGRLFNTILDSAIEHYQYTSMNSTVTNCQSDKHDGVDGALKAWCKGGVVTSQTTVKPDGYAQAYLLDPESATLPVFFTEQFSVPAGQTFSVEVKLRKDASMTYLPRAYLMASIANPLAGATPVDSFIMTDSTDTWETDTFSIANATAYDQDYTLWFVAQNADGNAYAAYKITPPSGGGGGGGAVSIRPIIGRLG